MTLIPPPPPPSNGEGNAPKRRRFLAAAPSVPLPEAANEPHRAPAPAVDDDFPLLTEVVSPAPAKPKAEALSVPRQLPPHLAETAAPVPLTSLATPLSADLARALEARLADALPQIIEAAQDAALAVLHQRIEQATQAAIEGALADLLRAAPPLPNDPQPT